LMIRSNDLVIWIVGFRHGTNTVAANYGSGYALDKLREHMSRVWETRFSQDIKTMETA